MDFSAPYRIITPTLDGPVLRALAGVETPLTRGQVVSLVRDASEAGVRKVLARLVAQGIVIEDRIGSRYTYHANREHLLWPSVAGIFAARDLLAERVRALTAGWDVPVVSAELFGSVADGTAAEDSDVDVLILRFPLESGDQHTWDRQIDELHDHVARWTGNACDVAVLGLDELVAAYRARDPLLEWTTYHLAGQSFAAIRRWLDLTELGGVPGVDTDLGLSAETLTWLSRLMSAEPHADASTSSDVGPG